MRQQGGQRARGLGACSVGRARPGLAGGRGQEQEGPEEQEGRHGARRRSDGAARLGGEARREWGRETGGQRGRDVEMGGRTG